MPANQPYDPRYNAKIYVPKLTQEERRARATPLENLRGLRFRTETPAAPSPSEAAVSSPVPARDTLASPSPSENVIPKSAAQVTAATSSTPEAVVPAPVQAQIAHAPHYLPTAREVLFAEFPELIPFPDQKTNCVAHRVENSLIGEPCMVARPDWELPRHNKTDARSRYPEFKPRSAQHQRHQTFTEPSSFGQYGQLQQGYLPRIVNGSRARLPGLILAIP